MKILIKKITNDQKNVISYIINSVVNNKQSLIMMHGSGGVGKSTVIKYLIQELKSMGKTVLCTCPTGSGAVLLTKGLTFHHAFKVNSINISIKTINKMMEYLTDDIYIIVVDKVSMLSMEYLVILKRNIENYL